MPPNNPLDQVTIRCTPQPGDIGQIVYLHGVIYAREYGLDWNLEAYVAEGLARFVTNFDPAKDCLWLAEVNSQLVGCIGAVGLPEHQAQLRWFLVHPAWRGRGLGRRLMQAALDFCAARGFRSVFLWTFSELQVAAHLYESYGFRKAEEKTHPIWGRLLTEVRYECDIIPTCHNAESML